MHLHKSKIRMCNFVQQHSSTNVVAQFRRQVAAKKRKGISKGQRTKRLLMRREAVGYEDDDYITAVKEEYPIDAVVRFHDK